MLGLVLGIGGFAFVASFNPPDASTGLSPSTVFDRIVSQNEMVSVSQNYSIVNKASDTNRLFDFIDIPFTENSFWYRYAGTLKAGVNMKEATFAEVDGVITVGLTEPYIVANTLNYDKTGVLEERNNFLNPIHVEDVDAFQSECDRLSREEAVADGLLNQARESVAKNLQDMFTAAFGEGVYEIKVEWKESAREA